MLYNQTMRLVNLGLAPYREGLLIQELLRDRVERGDSPGALLFMEHYPVITRGRRTRPEELCMSPEFYEQQGIEVVEVDRGGKATFHGPGQLVGYPILPVSRVGDYVRGLERLIVESLAEVGVEAHTRPGAENTGVWCGEEKIACIGVHLRRGITTHGFSVNLDMDMQPWEWINPCGLGCKMTSVALQGGSPQRASEIIMRVFSERIEDGYAIAQ